MKNEKKKLRCLYELSQREKEILLKQGFQTKPCVCACEDFIIMLNSKGEVFLRKENESFSKKLNYSRVVKICGGKRHFVGLRADGTVFAMGSNEYGQCNVHKWKNVVDIAAEQNYTVGMTSDENMLVTGVLKVPEKTFNETALIHKMEQTNKMLNRIDVEKLTKREFYEFKDYIMDYINNYISIVADNEEQTKNTGDIKNIKNTKDINNRADSVQPDSTAVKKKTVSSQTHKSSESQSVDDKYRIHIAVGKNHIVGVKPDGTVAVYGKNEHGECNVGRWKNIQEVAVGDTFTVGLKTDGTAVSCGSNDRGQCNVFGFKDMIQIAAGAAHTVGLKSDGKVIAVGDNRLGQCDVGDWDDVKMIAVSDSDTFAVKNDGRIVGCGFHKEAFKNVFRWRNMKQIALGKEHIVGLGYDGKVLVEGKGFYNDDRYDINWENIVTVAAGSDHIVALKSDGTVSAVGKNKYGECNVLHWKDIVAVSANYNYTFGLKADGNVVGVGRGYNAFFKMYWKLRIV